ncbi:MAG: amidohydrolase family protein [Vicinamibacterales bacterium]
MRRTLFAVVLLAALAGRSEAQPYTLIENVTVVDASAEQSGSIVSVLVHGDLIEAVEPHLARPEGAHVIDGTGRFVVPGLWDMHAHLAALTPIGRAPERYVGHGVLHLRDMGGFLDQLSQLREDIGEGRRTGPTLVIAGPTVNSEQPAAFHRKVTTAAAARAAVRELKGAGVDFIKLHRATTREVFEAVVDEARLVALPFAGHVPLALSWVEASRAGMRTIEHVQTIFENLEPDRRLSPEEFTRLADALGGALGDQIFGVLKANGTFFDPTLIGYEAAIGGARPAVANARREAYSRMRAIVARAARAGVPIITGTDVLDRHGEMLLQELERLVEVGLSPRAVLAAATVTSSAAAGRPETGHVRVGSPATFLLVDANPLDDIRALRTLSLVVLRGRVLTAADLESLRRD